MRIYKNLNQAFVEELRDVFDYGLEVKSRGFTQKEKLFASLAIQDPTDISIEVPARKFNKNYGILEWLWYLNADSNITNIGKFADIWKKISDEKNEVESNYGCYLKPQWEYIVSELLEDKDSRRATIVINQPYHKSKNLKDYPCTQYIHFFIRENKLHLGVYMRSNDAIFGFCNDVFTFCLFQQLMLNELNSKGLSLSLGDYHHSAGSLHIYDRHYSMMEKISQNYYKKFQTKEYPILEKTVLKENFRWVDLAEIVSFLSKDLSKENIEFELEKIKRVIFE